MSDGTIPPVFQERLLALGKWLDVNGAAIYSTRPWRVQEEAGSKVYYTHSPQTGAVYALLLDWPADSTLALEAPKVVAKPTARLLGVEAQIGAQPRPAGGLALSVPAEAAVAVAGEVAWAFELRGVA